MTAVNYLVGGMACLGAMLLICAVGITLFLASPERLGRNLLLRTPVMRCRDLTVAPRLPRRVMVSGAAVAGPAGILTAPLSEQRCVWYRLQVWCEYSDREGTYDRLVSEHDSDDVLRIRDDSGVVAVGAALLGRDLPASNMSPLESPRSKHRKRRGVSDPSGLSTLRELGVIDRDAHRRYAAEAAWVVEQIVRPGRAIVVLGAPRRVAGGVVLDKPMVGRSGVSRRDPAQLRQRASIEDRDNWAMARGMALAGLVLIGTGYLVHRLLSVVW